MKSDEYLIFSEFEREFMQEWNVEISLWIPAEVDLLNWTPDGDEYAPVSILENRYGKNRKLKTIRVIVDTDEKRLKIAWWYFECLSELEAKARKDYSSLYKAIHAPWYSDRGEK